MSAYHPEPTLTHVVPQPLLPLMTTTTARLVFTGVGIIVTGILWGGYMIRTLGLPRRR